MACSSNRYDTGCDGCRRCMGEFPATDEDRRGYVRTDDLSDRDDRIRRADRRRALPGLLIRDRANN